MACHEIAALRLGLMKILGVDDEAEKAHELAELGPAAHEPGPLASLTKAADLDSLVKLFTTSLIDLNEKVARTGAGDPKLPYLRSLVVLTKKVELELRAQVEGLSRMNRELEEMHDLVHELFPAE
ncbi:DUF3209 family protein [Pendulispora albinea]|uniref:DUF3209 family protein n=1 Tax=Pendulispora albinea TaxID=2741071 RepID=A0ABZ2M251_9BACT